jgi:hypothetical protein
MSYVQVRFLAYLNAELIVERDREPMKRPYRPAGLRIIVIEFSGAS